MIGCDRIHRQSSAEVVLVCSFVMLGPLCCPLFLGLVVSYARVALPLHFAIYHPIVLPAILFATAVVYCVSCVSILLWPSRRSTLIWIVLILG